MCKFKLSTFIRNGITVDHMQQPGFASLLAFPSEIFIAHISPKTWEGGSGQRPSMREELLFPGSSYFDYVQGVIHDAARIEMTIVPYEGGSTNSVAVEIMFKRGRKTLGKIFFNYRLDDGSVGAGSIGESLA